MRIEGAIFDMDGTLLDSMFVWDTVPREYLRSRGISPGEETVGLLEHMTVDEAVEHLRVRYALPESHKEILGGLERTVGILYETVTPKPGVSEALALLRAHGVRMALATLTDRPLVERTLGRLGLLSYFDAIFTCAEVGAPKTSPRIYEAALAALGTRREATPVFEDAWYAIKTAKAAGFPIVAVYDDSGKDRYARAVAVSEIAVPDWRALDLSLYLT